MTKIVLAMLLAGLLSACVSDPMNLRKWQHIDGSPANSEAVRAAYNECKYGYYHTRFMASYRGDRFREWKIAEQCMRENGFVQIK